MLGTYFYHEIFKKTIVGFGTLFNNIQLKRSSNDGTNVEVMKVPLAYGPAEKFLARLRQDPDPTNKKVQITLPRISFELSGITYDPSRKVAPTQIIRKDNNQAFIPVPYNLSFELNIIAKNQDDSLQILEQILPFFQPSFNISLQLAPYIEDSKDVPIVLENVSYQDEYEGGLDQKRIIIYSLKFEAKTYLYGPVKESSGVIKKVIADSYSSLDTVNAPRVQRYSVEPDPFDADADDDFGFNEIFSEFSDMKKRNPDTGVDEDL
jgi:hypothetical protein